MPAALPADGQQRGNDVALARPNLILPKHALRSIIGSRGTR
jgi:hypothetical protein